MIFKCLDESQVFFLFLLMCKTILAVVGDAVCSFQQPWYKTEVLCHDDDNRNCKTVNKMIHKISS